jgi:phosphoesterase RecJ-like protein
VAALIQEQINDQATTSDRVHLHVSLRSDGSVDVAAIAGAFGGGGHHSAAGFQIESTPANIKSELLAWAERM